jgi:hypothetical protein
MSSKKTSPTAANDKLQTLRLGCRVRCTDDRVAGRIVWANGLCVKIHWDDGEQVTWRRDSLATRPIEILDAEDDVDQGSPTETPASAPMGPAEPATPMAEQSIPTEPATLPDAAAPAPVEQAGQSEAAANDASVPTTAPTEVAPPVPDGNATAQAPLAEPTREQKQTTQKEKKVSALDAAARVLAETGVSMNCQQMIEAMAAKGYWTSPGGKTPAATLASAILRELQTRGTDARFEKTGRGLFTCKSQA